MTYKRIQDQDVKGTADVSSDADLINDTKIYVTGDGLNKRLDQAITDGDIGGGGSGGVNYIENSDFEKDAVGYNLYNDSSEKPIDGQGGTTSCTFVRTTTGGEVLSGVASGKFSHPGGGSKQGEGVAYDLVDFDLKGASKFHEIAFDFTYDGAPDQVALYMIASNDGFTSDFNRIEPTANLVQSSSGRFSTYFQSWNNTYLDYRLCVHIKGAGTTAWDLIIESVRVGDLQKVIGASYTSDRIPTTPTGSFVANATYTGSQKRIGDELDLIGRIDFSGATTAVNFSIDIPDGLTIDSSKIDTSNANTTCGTGLITNSGTGRAFVVMQLDGSTNSVRGSFINATGSIDASIGGISNTSPFTIASGDILTFNIRVPITEWATPNNNAIAVTQNNSVIAMHASASSTSISDNAAATLIFNNVEDTSNGYNPANGEYTIKESGWHSIDVGCEIAVTSPVAGDRGRLEILVGGVTEKRDFNEAEGTGSGLIYSHSISYTKYYEKDQVLSVSYNNEWGETVTFNNSDARQWFSVNRLSGYNQIIGNENVSVHASDSSVQSVTTSRSDLTWNTEDRDTFNSFDGTTFTAIVPGEYEYIGQNNVDGAGIDSTFLVYAMKNGSDYLTHRSRNTSQTTAESLPISYSGRVMLEQGETLKFQKQLSSGSFNLSGGVGSNRLFIRRVGN